MILKFLQNTFVLPRSKSVKIECGPAERLSPHLKATPSGRRGVRGPANDESGV
jgi:hypothetical protein